MFSIKNKKFIPLLAPVFFVFAYWVLLSLSLRLWPLPETRLSDDNYSTLHLDRDGRLLRISLSPDGKYRVRLPLKEVAGDLRRGIVQYEDGNFYRHPGVNPASLFRAFAVNLKHRRVVMGGSTITMQTAKLLEPRRRTVGAKILEILRALQLEFRYSKNEILEIYLNRIPLGGNIEGAGAGAYLYFGKPARDLSFGECSLLIALPKSPNLYRPDVNGDRALRQKIKVMRRVAPRLGISEDVVRQNAAEAVPRKRWANPFLCPHWVIRTEKATPGNIRRYAIDGGLQSFCEEALAKTVGRLRERGVHNGAVIVVENKTMKIRAYAGSPDFGDSLHGGQINGADIRRSPGSLLKPFLYSLALERGMLTPKTLVYDIERNYDGYVPSNFERRYAGPLSAEDALAYSLNIPAVNLQFEMGSENGLADFLRRARFSYDKRDPDKAGLSLSLGAFPMSLEELTRLYTIFPNGGRLREFKFLEEDSSPNEGVPLFRSETVYIAAQMLSRLERPDLPQAWEFTHNRGRIGFKTGTSFGLRDAWSVGFNPDFTVGVWIGNADAKGSSALIGAKAAAPLLVEIFNDLTRYGDSWFKKPEGVSLREVCVLSGEPAGLHCPGKTLDSYIPGVSAARVCSLHRKITLRKSDGLQVCAHCMTGSLKNYAEKVVEMWPPDAASFLRERGRGPAEIPAHNPACAHAGDDKSLRIQSPRPGGYYEITDAFSDKSQKIPLRLQARRGDDIVSWFIDDKFVGRGPADKVFYVDPAPGLHAVTVLDLRGQFDKTEFRVRRRF